MNIEDENLSKILSLCSMSTRVFAKTFFPERFTAEFSPLHDEIFNLIDSSDKNVAIAAPRGFGKTSIVILALAARHILFNISKFLVYVNMSETAAVLQTENLKRELTTNPAIRQFFGSIKAKGGEGIDETFSKKTWVTSNNCMVLPRGSGQQVRGLLYGNYRPQLVIIDDLEDAETIENDQIRKHRKEWFHSDLLKCVSRVDRNFKFVYIDTLKHEDSLLEELINSHGWRTVRLEACDDNYRATAPGFMSQRDIDKEVEYHRAHGIMDVFYREFRNIPISTEDAAFREEYFQYYDDTKLDKHSVETVMIIDPAKTAKMSSADSAIVAVGIDRVANRLYVRDIISGKMLPDELYDHLFEMKARLRVHTIGIEVTGLEEFIRQPLVNEMIKRKQPFEPVWLKARGGGAEDGAGRGKGKIKRIATLVPFYRMGYIFHNKSCCSVLESQLLSFPRSKRFDVMDALAYVIEMLELGDRYFEPPYEESYDPEEEFQECIMECEPPLENWRYA